MPFNGSGTFSRLYSWAVDAANNVDISSSRTDAEMNGFAAGLTNCITRDGQSPPSADLPMGGKRLTNLGAATTGSDALNRDTADTRYVLASGATSLTLSGGLTAATGAFSGNVTIGGTMVVSGLESANSYVTCTTNGTGFQLTDANGSHPLLVVDASNNLILYGTSATGTAVALFTVGMRNSAPTFGFNIGATGQTPTVGDNSTKLATTAFVTTAVANAAGAPLNSPAFTGTPTAPTAASGTATTQLATTAFVDGLRDVPQNAQTANYALALSDRGKSVDFNGASLTCTIPANASVAFPVGTTIGITNLNSSNLTIAITTDTLTMSGTTTTGSRTLGQNGEARLRKVAATSWIIAGTALS